MQKILYVVVLLGLVSFLSCLAAEFKKSKKKDVKWDAAGWCYVPESEAFRLGITAVICLTFLQIIGNFVIYKKKEESIMSGAYLFLSWISFAVVILLLSTATSMSQTQRYGQGWLNQECYLVKPGIFAAAGCLTVLTLASLLISAAKTTIRRKHVENDTVRHEKVGIKEEELVKKKTHEVVLDVEEEKSAEENLHNMKLKKDDDCNGVGRI